MHGARLFPLAIAAAIAAQPTFAWGDLGHEVTALIAYRHLTPRARAKLEALLASDPDTLTAPDFASRATWADKYRVSHRETAAWHFVDDELDHADLRAACFGSPALPAGVAASAGPAQDCVVDKITQFARELRDPATPPPERLLALKFLIHFVGDLHQPLHAADHHDRGGNCVGLDNPPDGRSSNLHAWWDTGVVESLGSNPQEIASRLDRQITPAEFKAWGVGDAASWAMDSYRVAVAVTYQLPSRPTCDDHAAIELPWAYQTAAQKVAAIQLEKAGVRIAYVLNEALGG
jgi:hypothetical protein